MSSELLAAVEDLASAAPAVHGEQPWAFSLSGHTLEVSAADGWAGVAGGPHDRELHVAAGVAVELARLAVRGRGHSCVVRLAPQCAGGVGHQLATLTVGHDVPSTTFERRLITAVPRWVPGPDLQGSRPVAMPDVVAVAAGAATERGCWLRLLDRPGDRDAARKLLLEMEHLGPHVASATDDTLLLVGTDDDTPTAWLRSGRALALTMLVLTDAGLVHDWSAAITSPSGVLTRFKRDLGLLGSPQLMLAVA